MGFAEALAAGDRLVRQFAGGEPVIYAPGTGSPVTVSGIFDAVYVPVDLSGAAVASQGPAVFLVLAELPTDPKFDLDSRVTIRGLLYRAHEVHPDGMGGTHLLLHLV